MKLFANANSHPRSNSPDRLACSFKSSLVTIHSAQERKTEHIFDSTKLHNRLLNKPNNTMKPSTNNSRSQAAAALLLIAIASSSSTPAAAADSHPSGVTCVDPSSLQLNDCLTAGNAICSPSEGFAFGVDPTDRRIKLWEGNQVRLSFAFVLIFGFACSDTQRQAPEANVCELSTTRRRILSDMHNYTREMDHQKKGRPMAYLSIRTRWVDFCFDVR